MDNNQGTKKFSIGPLSMIAIAFNTCNSWAGVSGSMQSAMLQGGPVTLLYGMIISTSAYLSIACVMGELTSVYPTAGGQYHFASILAPQRYHKLIAYICGLFNLVAWLAIASATVMLTSYNIITLVSALRANYVAHPWHLFLVYEAFSTTALLYNALAIKRASWIHDLTPGISVFFSLSLFVGCFVTVLVRSSPKQPDSFVWTAFLNYTGWGDGICFLTSLSNTCFLFGGLDASLHLVEEAEKPRRSVPIALICAVCVGFVTAFSFTTALLYGISDLDSILNASGFVTFEVWSQALRSLTGTAAFSIAGIVLAWFMTNAIYQTTSRLTVAFARDNAMVGSKLLASTNPWLEAPLNALLFDWFIVTLFGCLFLASSVAFNAILNSTVSFGQITYLIPSGLLLYRKRSTIYLPSDRTFRLPSWLGWILNVYVVIFTSVMTVFFAFPSFYPTTTSTFNYNIVIIGVVLFLGLANWVFYGRHHFHGPTILYQD
ncbi:amino acid/polyamine transporter I [Ilyonectria robusta]|uniref:amino acid/polyamine transporter I n=1 Tax=Ilyonectria robusta TaxID=1079257 RepID=UPI001E8E8A7B|nr:amino acid/polyamine transporter I [Ilyonectria robusta]KAH8649538.1 amino acid/polyamine transporter I [Ilyonectria robusta]